MKNERPSLKIQLGNQLQARERWTTVNSPAGELPALLPPGKQSAFDYRMDAVPKVGEHTEAILKELGIQR